MAAPTKEGLDYFPFDVDLLDNDDLDFLREKYGVVVNDVYIGLLTLLYRKKGYYIPYCTEAEKEDCVWYVYKRVRGGKYPVQLTAIPQVIESIVAQGLFDRDHFDKIITSERAQRTYYSATVERKLDSFDIKPEYWLLNEETMRKLSKKHPYYLSLCPESKSDEKSSKSDDYQSKSDEKPLNKSKVNITSNEVIKVSKKVSSKEGSNKDNSCNYLDNACTRESYDEIIAKYNLTEIERKTLYEFIKHCQLNGHTLTNDALTRNLVALMTYPAGKRGQAITAAIDANSYAIRALREKHYDVMGTGNNRDDYQSVMENCLKGYLRDSADIVLRKLWEFIQYCAANGQRMTNDRLLRLCVKLKQLYMPNEAGEMIKALDKAINCGYYDIKDGEGWMDATVRWNKEHGVDLFEDEEDDDE